MGKGYLCQSEARLQQVTARERAPAPVVTSAGALCTGQPRRLGSPADHHRRGRPAGDHGRRDLRLLGQPFWHRRARPPGRLGHQPALRRPRRSRSGGGRLIRQAAGAERRQRDRREGWHLTRRAALLLAALARSAARTTTTGSKAVAARTSPTPPMAIRPTSPRATAFCEEAPGSISRSCF
jgi:hypothetical protein